jgi:hypothetical protein
MTNIQANILKDIAGSKPTVKHERNDSFGLSFINKSEQWLQENKDLSSDTKLNQWMTNNSDWSFTPNNRQYYWDTVETLSPGSKEEVQKNVALNTRNKLQGLKTLEDKENYFRDKAHTFPDYVHKDLEEYFFNLRGINDRKNLEKTRIAQILEVDNLNKELSPKLNLAPDVSLETHTKEYLKAYDMGFSTSMATDSSGRITVPIEGQDVPVFTLPDPTLSLEEEFISLNDLTTKVRDSLKPRLEHSRNEVKESEKLANMALLNRVHTIPEEFRANVIIDGVIHHKNPVAKTNAVINDLISKEIQAGKIQSHGELSRRFFNMHTTIHDTLFKRINDGTS